MQNAKCKKKAARAETLSAFCILHFAFCILVSLTLTTCANAPRDARTTIEFWGLGREGEVVAEMLPEFHKRHPEIRVDIQQIPWTAAHEKLLTAHVGGSFPDLAQMGNTWVPEFETIGALEKLDPWVARSKTVKRDDYFDGIWRTNIVNGTTYGLPWYVDTRVIFYRSDLMAKAGFDHPPRTWSEWTAVMRRMKEVSGRPDFFPILMPTNEWPPPVLLALQAGATLITDDAAAHFSEPKFISAFDYYLSFYRDGLAPVMSNSQIANLYQQFGDGEFAMFITGPWNVGELRRRLPANMQDKWMTMPMPAPDGTAYPGVSLAGGSSLVLSSKSRKKEAAWKFIEFLSEPVQQARFYEKSGDLPARRSAWDMKPLAGDDKIAAFRTQFERTVPTPTIPEWEYIATTIFEHAELAARGQFDARGAASRLDAKVNRILEKRRWILEKQGPKGKDRAIANLSDAGPVPRCHPERSEGSPASGRSASKCGGSFASLRMTEPRQSALDPSHTS
ncbi:MAG: sugar ABC transporter substrate-binding protein [Thermoanaerobaculia bacterium]|nr:sugar ABC transporter substrate-binding protein [Thermoanaerobaculia bacterium]